MRSPLDVRLNLASFSSSGADNSDTPLPLGEGNNEDLPLDLTVETKPIFTVGEPLIGFCESGGV